MASVRRLSKNNLRQESLFLFFMEKVYSGSTTRSTTFKHSKINRLVAMMIPNTRSLKK